MHTRSLTGSLAFSPLLFPAFHSLSLYSFAFFPASFLFHLPLTSLSPVPFFFSIYRLFLSQDRAYQFSRVLYTRRLKLAMFNCRRQAESHEKKKKTEKITQTISSCVTRSITRSKIHRNVYVPGSCFIRSDHFLPFLLGFLFFSILFLSFTSSSRPHLCAPCSISFSLLHLFLSRESTISLPLSLSISLLFPLFPALFHSAYTLATRALRVSGRVYSRIELSFLTYLPPNATVRFLLESFHQLFCQSQFRSSLRALPFFPRASAIVPVPRPFRSLSVSLSLFLFLFSSFLCSFFILKPHRARVLSSPRILSQYTRFRYTRSLLILLPLLSLSKQYICLRCASALLF